MKTRLLTTTAIVAGVMLAASATARAQQTAKPAVRIGGFYDLTLGWVGSEEHDDGAAGGIERAAVDTNTDAEVHFKGDARLDNGISIGAHVELEANTDSDQIDETYVIIRGVFGQFVIGAENGAAELMTAPYFGASASVGAHYHVDGTDYLAAPDWVAGTTGVSHYWEDGDNEKITYYTPRMSGLQIGASFIPDYSARSGDGDGGANTYTTQHNGYQIAANYVGRFGGASVAVAAGYHAAAEPGDPVSTANGFSEYGFAIRADFGPLRLAMGRRMITDGGDAADGVKGDITDFGIRYTIGAVRLGGLYVLGGQEGTLANPDDHEMTAINVGAETDLGPGVTASLNWVRNDWDGEAAGTADDNGGWSFIAGLKVGF